MTVLESIERWVRFDPEVVSFKCGADCYADPQYEMRQLRIFQQMVKKGVCQDTAFFILTKPYLQV
jgi:hypothetical protein